MKKIQLKITGMTCDHCEKTVKDALTKTGAMVESVSFRTGEAICCFNSQQVSDEVIMQSLNGTNYKIVDCKEC